MALAGFVIGFADFKSSHPIREVATILSSKAFGGIRFVDKVVDECHDAGTLTLERNFLGIQVDLFGADGKYTLEIGTRPSASVEKCTEVCDLSEMLKHRLSQITGITV